MDGQITGLGVFKGTDGSEYHGMFLNGMRQGKGELRDALGAAPPAGGAAGEAFAAALPVMAVRWQKQRPAVSSW